MLRAFATSAAFVFFLSSGADAKLAAHRAVYDLVSENVNRRSDIISVEGRLAYELTGSKCEGWSVMYRFANRYVKSEGSVQLTDTQVNSWEADDGSEMQLTEKQFVDRALTEETSLSARKDKGKAGEVLVTKPTEKKSPLPVGALFSAEAQKFSLAEAAKGTVRLSSVVFEATDGDSVYQTISIIGAKRPGAKPESPEYNVEGMRSMPSWPMTVSYYAVPDDKSELPLYQTSYVMYENGVTSELVFDYGDYEMRGKLTKLELLPSAQCE